MFAWATGPASLNSMPSLRGALRQGACTRTPVSTFSDLFSLSLRDLLASWIPFVPQSGDDEETRNGDASRDQRSNPKIWGSSRTMDTIGCVRHTATPRDGAAPASIQKGSGSSSNDQVTSGARPTSQDH